MRQENDIHALRLGIHALHLLNERESLTCPQLAVALAVSRGTAHRVLGTLDKLGYVTRFGSGRPYRFHLHPRARALSDGFTGERLLTDVARPSMRRFTELYGWPVALGVVDGDACLTTFTTDRTTTRLLTRRDPGERTAYFDSAMGRVCLAYLPAATVAALARSRGLSLQEVDGTLQRIRDRQHVVDDRPGQREIDLAVPIRAHGTVVGALNLRYMRVAANGPVGHAGRLAQLGALARAVAEAFEARSFRGHVADDSHRPTA